MLHSNKIRIPFLIFTIYFLVISAGLPLHKHYCQGNLKIVSLFIQPDGCHDECCGNDDGSETCCSEECSAGLADIPVCFLDEENCCSDEVELVKVDYTSLKVNKEIENTQEKPNLLINSKIFACDFTEENNRFYQSYRYFKEKAPPSKLKLVLHQQFLC